MAKSIAQRLADDLRVAYEFHDRNLFEQYLARMVGMLEYAGPVPAAPAPQPSPQRLTDTLP